MKKLNITFKEAVEMLATMFGFSLEKGSSEGYSEYLVAAQTRKDLVTLSNTKEEKLRVLNELPGYYEEGNEFVQQYLKLRRFTDSDLVSTFQFYPCLDNYGILRMGIPAFDEDGSLVGVNARRMDGVLQYPEQVTTASGNIKKIAKYDMISNFKKGSVLFNLNVAKDFLDNFGLIVVEGELSAVRMYSYGFKNTVAIRGSSITAQQASLLYKNCFNVVFLVESGEAAENGVIASIAKIPGMRISVAKLNNGDPDDNSKEQVKEALSNVKNYTNSDISKCLESGKLL